MPDEDRDQVSWNIAAAQAKTVSDLINKAIVFYLRGSLNNWFWALTALREMVNYELKELERKVLDKLEEEVGKTGTLWKKHNSKENKNKKYMIAKTNHVRNIRIYQRQLMDYLKELGYFPNKEDRTQLSF